MHGPQTHRWVNAGRVPRLLGMVPFKRFEFRSLRATSERAVHGPQTHRWVNAVRDPMLAGIVPVS